MLQCRECGYQYNDNLKACPKCGNPSHLSIINNNCPNCGAELKKVQGYNFVCEYCGTITPVDSQTRAKIDAEKRKILIAQQMEYNKIAQKKTKKVLIRIGIIVLCIIAAIIAYNSYISYKVNQEKKEHEEMENAAKEKLQNVKNDIIARKPQSAYISPSDIFVTGNTDLIGHLNQNLIATLEKKGFEKLSDYTYNYYPNGKTADSDNYSYYDDDYNASTKRPLISVHLNSYKPSENSKRLNETDAIHSVSITINDKNLRTAYIDSFKNGVANLGFTSHVENKYEYESSSDFFNFKLFRFGNQEKRTENYLTKISANWEGIGYSEYGSSTNGDIICVAFREL